MGFVANTGTPHYRPACKARAKGFRLAVRERPCHDMLAGRWRGRQGSVMPRHAAFDFAAQAGALMLANGAAGIADVSIDATYGAQTLSARSASLPPS